MEGIASIIKTTHQDTYLYSFEALTTMQNHSGKMDFVVDIQSLRDDDGKFFPKEVAVAALQKNIIDHWLVKSPCDFNELPEHVQETNTYCSTQLHGIHWFDGDTTIKSLQVNLQEISKSAVNVYVRGDEKAKFLQNLMGREVTNIELYQAPTFAQLNRMFPKASVCTTHGLQLSFDIKYYCALQKVLTLKEWFDSILLEEWLVDGIVPPSECYKQSLLKYSRE